MIPFEKISNKRKLKEKIMSEETIPKRTKQHEENTSVWITKENHKELRKHYDRQGIKLSFALNQIIKQHIESLK